MLLSSFVWHVILPALGGSRKSNVMSIVSNLRQIEMMKEIWASDHGLTNPVRVSEADLAPYAHGYLSNGLVRPVMGERYSIHRLGIGPEAQLTRPSRSLPTGTVIRLRYETNRPYSSFCLTKRLRNQTESASDETNVGEPAKKLRTRCLARNMDVR